MRMTMAPIGALVLCLALAGTAAAQGLPGLGGGVPGLQNIPGLGQQPETPEQKRAFCQRIGGAAARCMTQGGLSLDMVGITACAMRGLPPQDQLRVAQVADRSRGSAASLFSECGISLGR
jgi:hypothetical protein